MNSISLDTVNQLRDFNCTGMPEERKVVAAEEALDLRFSTDYLEITKKYGAISFYGHHFTGISPFPGNNVVKVTIEQRSYNPQVPKDFYVIEEAHIDGIIVWQNSRGNVFQTYPNGQPLLLSSDLYDYIAQLIII